MATAYFRRALREGGSGIRLRAMVGLASTYLGIDLDAISGVYRHIRIRQEASELAAGWHTRRDRRRWIIDRSLTVSIWSRDRHPVADTNVDRSRCSPR